jgi:hypothetical protein
VQVNRKLEIVACGAGLTYGLLVVGFSGFKVSAVPGNVSEQAACPRCLEWIAVIERERQSLLGQRLRLL